MCKIELTSLKNLDATKTESLNALRATIEEQKEHINVLNEQVRISNIFIVNITTLHNIVLK